MAQSKLGKVKKGEKATDIHYWKFHDDRIKKDENGNKVLDKNGKPVKIRVELDYPRVFYAKVFNADQIEGLPEKKVSIPVMEEWERHARCEDIVKNSGVEVINRPSDTAYYHPAYDHIVMPERSQFESADLYYSTLVHELGHSTGHPSRLNRDLSGGFGSEKYAKEELRAEMSSMMLGQELQIGHDPERHIAYLASWAKAIENDPNEIFKAVKDADAMTKYMLAFEQSMDKTQEVDSELSRDLVAEMKQIHDEKKEINEQIPTAYEHYGKIKDLAEANGYQVKVDVVDEQVINFGTHERFKIDIYEDDRATDISINLTKTGTGYVSYGETDLNSAYSRKQDVTEELNRAFALDRSRDTPQLSIQHQQLDSEASRYSVSEFDHTRQTEWQNQLVNGVVIEDKVTDEHYVLMNIQDGIGYDPTKNLDSYDDDVIYSVAEYYSSKETYQAQEQTKLVEQDFDILRKIGINPQSKDDDIRRFASQFPNNGDVFYKGGAPAEVVPSLTVTNIESMLGRDALTLNTDEQKIIDAINEAGFSEVTKAKLEVEILDSQSQLSHTVKSDLALNDKVAVYADEINRYAGVDKDKVASAVTRLEQSFNTTLNPEDKQFDTTANQQKPFEAETNLATQKTYLFVPFEEKDEAKKLGAKWDKDNKSWYAPEGADLNNFSKWREQPEAETNVGTNLSAEDEFTLFLKEKGVKVKSGHPKLDGRWHRLPAEDDKAGSLSASYVVHTGNGIPRGYFKNFKSGEEEKWVSQQRTTEATRPNIDLEKVRAEAEAKAKAEYDNTAKIAEGVYSVANPANPTHGYLVKKGVTAEGGVLAVPANNQLPEELQQQVVIGADWREAKALRDNPNEGRLVLTQGDLLIPIQNKDNEIRTLQTIAENGFKGYLKGGEKGGNYSVIGEIEQDKPFIVTEGWATGKTIHEQTGQPVVVAFDKNNLVAVAEAMREKHPENRIYLGADNDHEQEAKYVAEGRTGAGGELNGGIEKAEEAADKINAFVLVPHFEKDEHGSDWNDVYVDKGAEEFTRQMRHQVIKARDLENAIQQPKLEITTVNFTDPELAKVQQAVIDRVANDTQGLINDYKAKDNTFDGRYIASDMMKEVFEEFNQSPAHRNQFNNAVHNAAASLAAEHFKQMASQAPSEGRDTVIMLTGAVGAGKTSSVLNDGRMEANVALIYEGQLANPNQATLDKFETALNAGYKVEVVAIHPKPEQALENTFKRFNDPNDGRGGSIGAIARIQGNTYDGLKAINEKFGDKVKLTVVDKAGGNQDTTKHIGWDKLDLLKSHGNEQAIEARLEDHLVKNYKEGRIDNDTFKQSAGTKDRLERLSARLDRQVSTERHTNERGRELPSAGSSKGNQLGQGHNSEVQPTDKAITSTSLRNLISKTDSLDAKSKQSLEAVVSAIEEKFDKHPVLQQEKYQAINNKIAELSQNISAPTKTKSKDMDM